MTDLAIPSTVRSWMENLDWNSHHVRWHAERQWDLLSPAVHAQLAAMGWSRAARQEGTSGNGRDFLFMHRAMLQLVRQQFPEYASLFLGWVSPPIDPDDANDPVPIANPDHGPFRPSMLNAIDRLTNRLVPFTTEDELGLYIQTALRPTPANPGQRSPDASSGIHNYVHNRFSDNTSPVNLGDPAVNLENVRFWKLHGWIDDVWSKFRQLKGLSDSDPEYVSSLQAEVSALLHHGEHHSVAGFKTAAAAVAGTANRRLLLESLPSQVRRPFQDSTSSRVQRLMTSTSTITTKEELIDYLQTAIQVEHATLPLYLTAMWSLKNNNGDHHKILFGIAIQEMLHLAIVCNLLKALGECPLIVPPAATIPVFPGQIPGLDVSDFMTGDIALEPFSRFECDKKCRIKLFMRIERPEKGDIDPAMCGTGAGRAMAQVPKFYTIGEFYDVIIQGIKTLAASNSICFNGSGQVTLGFPGFEELTVISSKEQAVSKLMLIQQQGEGTCATQASGSGQEELAHYYRFKQIVEEMKYSWASGKPVLDPSQSFPFPSQDQVRRFAPAPLAGYPESAAFDAAYSRMLNGLQSAWDGNPDDLGTTAITAMYDMSSEAIVLMDRGFGPNFHYVTPRTTDSNTAALAISHLEAALPGTPLESVAAAVSGYARIRQILDEAVNGENFGAHGAFWRSLTRDQFVAKSVFGRPLLQKNVDGIFDAQESNLIKALEGRVPFGKNMTPPVTGAIFNRMPDGYPPVPQTKIDEIRAWIGAGCPDIAPSAISTIDRSTPASISINDIIRFWRGFDDLFMFEATPRIQADIGRFFTSADQWFVFAKDSSKEANWVASIIETETAAGIRRLEKLQRNTIMQSFGNPTRLEDILISWEKFGDDSLPDDPLRPVDLRHSMNGTSMWFFWSAFTDAALRFSITDAAIPTDFWEAITRCVLLGLLNDGVFRRRFPVEGFVPTNEGKEAMRTHVKKMDSHDLSAELRKRFVDAGF